MAIEGASSKSKGVEYSLNSCDLNTETEPFTFRDHASGFTPGLASKSQLFHQCLAPCSVFGLTFQETLRSDAARLEFLLQTGIKP